MKLLTRLYILLLLSNMKNPMDMYRSPITKSNQKIYQCFLKLSRFIPHLNHNIHSVHFCWGSNINIQDSACFIKSALWQQFCLSWWNYSITEDQNNNLKKHEQGFKEGTLSLKIVMHTLNTDHIPGVF